MSPNNGIYPRKQQKPKTHMCIGKDLLHDGEPQNQQHQHQATLQPGEAVRRAMGKTLGPGKGMEEWMKWALQIQVNLRLNWEFVDFFFQIKIGYRRFTTLHLLGMVKWHSELENLGIKHLG